MCSLFFERFVLFFCLKIERFVPDSAEIWICGLYIQLSDTLTSEQEKTIRKALKVREDQLKQKAETQDSAKRGKRAARKAKLHTKEKKEKKDKDSGKNRKKDGKPEAEAANKEKGDASGEEEDEKEDKG